mmetsp:Transcript_15352/g.32003  ORF Transcript_15352/g.32003 Transcript_15352/m.32003 type:complete len:324 (-) Transcript_15352:17-988(-)
MAAVAGLSRLPAFCSFSRAANAAPRTPSSSSSSRHFATALAWLRPALPISATAWHTAARMRPFFDFRKPMSSSPPVPSLPRATAAAQLGESRGEKVGTFSRSIFLRVTTCFPALAMPQEPSASAAVARKRSCWWPRSSPAFSATLSGTCSPMSCRASPTASRTLGSESSRKTAISEACAAPSLPILPMARTASTRSRGARRFAATAPASEPALGPRAPRAAMAALRTSIWESISRGLSFAMLPSDLTWPRPCAAALRTPGSLLVRFSSMTGVACASWPWHVSAIASKAARLTAKLLLVLATSKILPKWLFPPSPAIPRIASAE